MMNLKLIKIGKLLQLFLKLVLILVLAIPGLVKNLSLQITVTLSTISIVIFGSLFLIDAFIIGLRIYKLIDIIEIQRINKSAINKISKDNKKVLDKGNDKNKEIGFEK